MSPAAPGPEPHFCRPDAYGECPVCRSYRLAAEWRRAFRQKSPAEIAELVRQVREDGVWGYTDDSE